jgi:VCBS repeat-containing protein
MTNLTQGDDTYSGGSGDDIVNGLGGNDTISGNGGDDQINGGGGDDILNGGANDDQLTGGSGNDTLTGGTGDDILTGGSGTDTAVINADGANGIGSHNGGVTSVITSDGLDQLTQIEFIQFNNGTVQIINGNAQAYLGADTAAIDQQGFSSGNVATNDFDIDDTMTITGFHSNNANLDGTLGNALHGGYGTLTLNADGTYSYAADASTNSLGVGESAVDTFTYTVHSGGSDFTQTVTITINGTNDDPTITSSATSVTYNDTSADDTFGNATGTVTASDVDAHDTLTYGATGAGSDISQSGYDMSVAGTYGTLYINSSTGAYEYIPNDDAIEALKTSASESFTFTVSDGHGGQDSQAFTVNLNGVNDTPTLGAITPMSYTDTSANDTFLTQSGTLNGADRDNDTLSYHATGENADVTQSGFDHSVAGTYGTLYFNAGTGAYEYIPNDGAIEGLKTTASETFSFTASDGSLSSASQTLTITLNGVNDTPDIVVDSPSNQLTEAGGVGNAISGTATATANTALSDRDTGDTPSFDTTALGTNGWTNDGGGVWHLHGTYGTASLNTATGVVTYTLDNNDSDTQGLQTGQTVHDIFTLPITDGSATNTGTVDFTINGANDAAVISGTFFASATEAGGVNNSSGGSPATGTVTDSDVDNAANTFQVVTDGDTTNHYGTFSIDASGHWTYNVDDSNGTVQALNVGGTLSDSFTIHSADGTSQTITVNINGTNDAAVVSGTSAGSVTESGGTSSSGTPTASGHLSDTDVDNTPNLFIAAGTTATDHSYGTYTMDASGNWSFTLDNNNLTIQALNDGDQITETFTVHTIDGTAQTVTITINGQNEQFTGTSGNNLMLGTVYGDTFTGGDGNDTYRINNTHDKIVELTDQGYDTAQTSVSYTLDANVESLVMSAHTNIDGTGNALNNSMIGNSGNNVLSGLGGDDVLQGGAGNDTLIGGDGDDNMDGGTGSDTASYASANGAVHVSLALAGYQDTGSAGTDKLVNIENLTGSGYDDTLTGSSASGAAGNNTITGGLGADMMTGGLGHDTFVYTSISDSTVAHSDVITDLQNNVDFIDLSALGNDFAIVNHFTNHADQITLHYDSGSNTTTIAIDTNGDGTADMQILATGDHHAFNDFIGLGP